MVDGPHDLVYNHVGSRLSVGKYRAKYEKYSVPSLGYWVLGGYLHLTWLPAFRYS